MLNNNDDSTRNNNDDSKKIRPDANDDITNGKKIITSIIEDGESVPTLDPNMLAADFFGSIYFYNGAIFIANHYLKERTDVFQIKTVKDVLEPLTSKDEVTDLFYDVGINTRKGISCWEEIKNNESPEDILNGKIIHHGGGEEIELIKNKFVELDSFAILTKKKRRIGR